MAATQQAPILVASSANAACTYKNWLPGCGPKVQTVLSQGAASGESVTGAQQAAKLLGLAADNTSARTASIVTVAPGF